MAKKASKKKSSADKPKKNKSYSDVILGLQKDFPVDQKIEWISSGSVLLDEIMGGGFPKGMFTEYHGIEGVGKSTFALQAGAHIARNNDIQVFYHDYEKAMNDNYIEATHAKDVVADGRLVWLRPTTFKDFEDIFDAVKDMDRPSFHIVDSIASITRSGCDTESVEDAVIGKDSLIQTRLVKKYKNVCAAKGITILWINQIRANIDFSPNPNKPTTKPAGGKAYSHALDVRVAFSRLRQIKEDYVVVGQIDGVQCIKNKFRISQHKYELPFLYGYGISMIKSLEQLMKEGSMYSGGQTNTINLPGKNKVQLKGKPALHEWIIEHRDEIVEALRNVGVLKYA